MSNKVGSCRALRAKNSERFFQKQMNYHFSVSIKTDIEKGYFMVPIC